MRPAGERSASGPDLAQIPAAPNPPPRPESSWHISAQLILPEPGKDLRLNVQSDECKTVVRGAIDRIKQALLLDEAFPHIISKLGYGRTNLLACAEAPEAAHIKERLTLDPKYAGMLADLVRDPFLCLISRLTLWVNI